MQLHLAQIEHIHLLLEQSTHFILEGLKGILVLVGIIIFYVLVFFYVSTPVGYESVGMVKETSQSIDHQKLLTFGFLQMCN